MLVETGLGREDVRRPADTLGAQWVEMAGLRLVPLGGHTAGHRGVAVPEEDRWLLHCGDAYYYHRELDEVPHPHPLLDVVQKSSEIDHGLRVTTQTRLRELVRDHGDEVAVFSAHDPWEFERFATAVAGQTA